MASFSRLLSTIDTSDVIPVDLNAVMCRNERTLSFMHQQAGNTDQANFYMQAYKKRVAALHALMWDDKHHQWLDYRIHEKR